MTGLLQRWLLALLLTTGAVGGAAADMRVLVVHEDSAVSRQVAELLGRDLGQMGWAVGEAIIGGERQLPQHQEYEQALVALGPRAFAVALRHANGKPVVAALVAQSSLDDLVPVIGDRWSAILLDQPTDRWINLIQTAFPGTQQVGMLVGPANQKGARLMERRLAERRLTLAIEPVSSAEEVVPALERLTPRMGLLLALPDPLAHNRNTVQPLLLTTYRAGIPVVAYSESYQQAGAVLALYSTMPQIVAQIVETLQQFQDTRNPPPALQSPRYFTIGVNTAVARSLGLSLPSASELGGRLRNLGQ
jgi:ABC-type uncharacterized transport system substrate-binding protein